MYNLYHCDPQKKHNVCKGSQVVDIKVKTPYKKLYFKD